MCQRSERGSKSRTGGTGLRGNRLRAPGCALVLVAALFACLSLTGSQVNAGRQAAELTVNRVKEEAWWPTSAAGSRGDFVGTQACGSCHEQEARTQPQTSMAKAAWRAIDTEVLRAKPSLSLETAPFLTTITRNKKGSTYAVGRGGDAMSGQVTWVMGNATMGQTFILESNNLESRENVFESQLSYFAAIGGLDITPGHVPGGPRDLEHAFGEPMSQETAARCFGCHTTASSLRRQFDPQHATPGVTCEACHGPGLRHVQSMSQGKIDAGKAAILNPANLNPVALVDYCGACHRTPMDVIAAKDIVPINVRFQPYRLAKSRCWSQPDRRITCIACHNPHEEVVRDAKFYDSKCLACHSGLAGNTKGDQPSATVAGNKSLPVCPVKKSDCTSCHMPKYRVPQMRGSFTDHDIRVVREGSPFPL